MLTLAAAYREDLTCRSPRQLQTMQTEIQLQGSKHTSQSSKAQADRQRPIRYQVQLGQWHQWMGLQQRLRAWPPQHQRAIKAGQLQPEQCRVLKQG